MKKDIINCNLPLPIQRLYIKRLKHMIQRWEFENFCGHCPVIKGFGSQLGIIKKLQKYHYQHPCYESPICAFCIKNVKASKCPCNGLGPKEALKRAKDFVERFEAEDGGESEKTF